MLNKNFQFLFKKLNLCFSYLLNLLKALTEMNNVSEKCKFLAMFGIYSSNVSNVIETVNNKKTEFKNLKTVSSTSSSISTLENSEDLNNNNSDMESENDEIASRTSTITISSIENSIHLKKQIKLRKAFLYSIPFFILVKNNFYHQNNDLSSSLSQLNLESLFCALNSSQKLQFIYEQSIKPLKKTQFISYEYEKYCNKTDNTNIEYEYQESKFYSNSKRRQQNKSIDNS
jgi:hypothetical protein